MVGQLATQRWTQLVADALSSGVPKRIEETQGDKTFSYDFVPIVDSGYVNIYGNDITERKRLEEQLRNAERFAAIGQTAAMVGQDLRNPLQAIVGYISIAEKKLQSMDWPSEEKNDFWESLLAINDQTFYMNKIVSDLEDYARPLKPELKETDLFYLVNRVLATMRVAGNIEVSNTIPDGLPKVMVDQPLMMRVFTNLIRNAVEAMPNGGRLTIEASQAEGKVVVSVSDTGVGIAPENMSKLFQPLFTTKAKGQGLGLPVCKRIVEAHNGTITAKSEPGKGSTFTVEIPRGVSPKVYREI